MNNNLSVGNGYGKSILYNEHFVVYNIPAIVSAIGMKTTATVYPNDRFQLVDERPETPGYKKEKQDHQKQSLQNMLKAMKLTSEQTKVKIMLSGNLVAASGIGSSAASCVAIVRALNNYYHLDLSDEKINKVAYEGEKGYHGDPSGIDNTAATYGGLIWFQRTSGGSIMEKIKIKEPVKIVIGNTGKVANTKKAVEGVRQRKENYPEKYEDLFNKAKKLVYEARKALENFDLREIGRLMNKNHRLLQEIKVSSKELDLLVNTALDAGAFGAKLTGGGLGGNMVALTPSKELQKKVANAIEWKGFKTLKTVIGVSSGGEKD
jgi:mevalonate kinase